jgi:signal transduction histidine kinase
MSGGSTADRSTAAGRADLDGGGERARLAFLAEASRRLSDSLDYEATLVTVAGLALPHLGAWCIVDLLEPDGSIRRLAVIHPDPAKHAPARDLYLRPPGPGDAVGAPRVMRLAEPEIVAEGLEIVLACDHCDAEHRALLLEMGAETFLTVPMVARGRMVGAITFATSGDGHGPGEPDRLIAEDLARRCAMAIDNARLYGEAQTARGAAERALDDARTLAREAAAANERLVLSTLREQELAEEAQAANRAKSDFLSTMSHELRTPLTAIIAYTDLLDMGISGPVTERQKAHLERIKAACGHVLTLVNDVLDQAKVEAGQLAVERASVSAAESIAASVPLVTAQAAAGGVEIDVPRWDGEEPFYLGDRQRVRQVLVNILANAVKFTERGGRVTVTCGCTRRPDPETGFGEGGRWTYVRVRDTGIGIAPDQLAAVFRPFVQVDTGHTRTGEGTGLGLAIARDLAVRMGGALTLRSEVGVGSCFTLWLPACSGAAPPSQA